MNYETAAPQSEQDTGRDDAITDQVSMLLEAYGRRVTSAQILGYLRALRGLSPAQVEGGVQAALESPREHPPAPGQLRELSLVGAGGYQAMAEGAWHEFTRGVERVGGDNSVEFEDGLVNAVIRQLGGWTHCCSLTGEDFEKWLRRDFIEKYVGFCQRPPAEDMLVGHIGRLRQANAGYSDAELNELRLGSQVKPRRIGTSRPVLASPPQLPLKSPSRRGLSLLGDHYKLPLDLGENSPMGEQPRQEGMG